MGLLDLKQIKCKTCGEPLDLNEAVGGVIKCGVCDSCFTLPKFTAEQKVLDYLFQAEGDLDTGKFDDAYTKFAKAAELDKTEPEAYWGMALAEYKVQYLKDEVNNRLQPICHEINDKDFTESPNFLKALRYATEAQRAEYERKGNEINYIKNEFYKIAKSGVKYDCFICVKVSDENGGRTADYKTADDIYFELKGKGYKPFFSERELGGVTGADYEARILYALYSSECMLVVCFDEAYLRTKWVKNEYTRFLKLVNDEEKESDSIALVFGNKPIEKLPNKHGKIQGIAINSLTAMERIVSFVDNHTPEAKRRREQAVRKREEEAKRKAAEDEALRKKLTEQEELIRKLQEQMQNQSQPSSAGLSDEELFERFERARKEKERKEAERKAAEEKAKQEAEQARMQAERERQEKERKEREAREAAERAKREAERQRAKAERERIAREKREAEERERKEREAKEAEERARREAASKMSFAYDGVDRINNSNDEVLQRAKIVAEERARKEAEERAKREEQERIAQDFEIVNGELKKYKGITAEKELYYGLDYEVVIPNGVTKIGAEAFSGCGVTSIIIPDGVTSIGNEAFSGCGRLKSITIPNSVTLMGSEAFRGCSSLKNITIPNGITFIGEFMFSFCTELKSVKMPHSVKSIGWNAFCNCWELASINVPESVTNICQSAFTDCRGLKSIIIPESVTSVGDGAFFGCEKLTIYCRAEKKPKSWHKDWDKKSNKLLGGRHKVVWGYKGE